MSRFIVTFIAAVMLWSGAAAADPDRSGPILVMVEQPGCIYCAMWDETIAPIYPKTSEGRHAPLLRADLNAGAPEGIAFARKVTFTPTFVLVDQGREQARIEGYPGEEFFWSLLDTMLVEHTGYVADDS